MLIIIFFLIVSYIFFFTFFKGSFFIMFLRLYIFYNIIVDIVDPNIFITIYNLILYPIRQSDLIEKISVLLLMKYFLETKDADDFVYTKLIVVLVFFKVIIVMLISFQTFNLNNFDFRLFLFSLTIIFTLILLFIFILLYEIERYYYDNMLKYFKKCRVYVFDKTFENGQTLWNKAPENIDPVVVFKNNTAYMFSIYEYQQERDFKYYRRYMNFCRCYINLKSSLTKVKPINLLVDSILIGYVINLILYIYLF